MPRVLTEPEYNAITQQVLASMPKGLSEQDFNHMLPSMIAGAVATAENSPAPMQGSALGRFLSGFGQSVNPMGLIEAIVNPNDPRRALQQGMAISDQISKARTAPTTSERLGHYAAAAIPPIGIPAANAGEAIGSGDVAGGLGQATGLLAPIVGPELLAKAAASQTARDAGQTVKQIGKGLAKKVGVDPDAMERRIVNDELIATRRQLQSARMRTRQLQAASPFGAESVNDAGRTIEPLPSDPQVLATPSGPLPGASDIRATSAGPDASIRAETMKAAALPDESAPAEPAPTRVAGRAAAVSPSRAEGRLLSDLIQGGGLNEAEARTALLMIRKGLSPEEIHTRLLNARQLAGQIGTFAKLPTEDELASQLAYQAAKNAKE